MSASTKTVALACAALLAMSEVAQSQQPTLQFDRGCYTEQQGMLFTGAGYTPSGQVELIFFAGPNEPRGVYSAVADAGGALNDVTHVDSADQFLEQDEGRGTILISANDRTRIDADQQPPETQFGVAQFTFTRWGGFSPGRFTPGRRATVEIYGWAFAVGETAWFLFRKGSRTVASVKVGRLDQGCGDRTARIRVPRSLKPGSYRVVLTTDRALRGPYTWRKARVRSRRSAASAAAAAGRGMLPVGGAASAPSVAIDRRGWPLLPAWPH